MSSSKATGQICKSSDTYLLHHRDWGSRCCVAMFENTFQRRNIPEAWQMRAAEHLTLRIGTCSTKLETTAPPQSHDMAFTHLKNMYL